METMDTYVLYSIIKHKKSANSSLDEWDLSFFDGNLKAVFHQHGENQAAGFFRLGDNTIKSVVLSNTSNKPIGEWQKGDELQEVFYDIRNLK